MKYTITLMLTINVAASNACCLFNRSKKNNTATMVQVKAPVAQQLQEQKSVKNVSLAVASAKAVSQQVDPLRFLQVPTPIGTPSPNPDSESIDSKRLPIARYSISPVAAAASTKVSLRVSSPSHSSSLPAELVSPGAITAQCVDKALSPLPEKPDAQSLKSEKSVSHATRVLSPSVRGPQEADARPILISSEPDAATQQLHISRIVFADKELVSLATEDSLTMVRVKPQQKKRVPNPDSPQEGGKSLIDFQTNVAEERTRWEKVTAEEARELGKTVDQILEEKKALQVLLDGPHPSRLPTRVRNRIKPDPAAAPPH